MIQKIQLLIELIRYNNNIEAQKYKKQMKQQKYSISYCDLINLKDNRRDNKQQLWTDRKNKYQKHEFHTKKHSYIENKPLTNLYKQSYLEQSALLRVRNDKNRIIKNTVDNILSKSINTTFKQIKDNQQQNSNSLRKKVKITKTIQPQLSQNQQIKQIYNNSHFHQFSNLILYPHIIGLSDIVYTQVMGKQKYINTKLIHSWKQCLQYQDKQEIYGPNISYSIYKVFPINQLKKGFGQIYGRGKKRTLMAGQQAILIHNMGKYLQKCQKQIQKIARKCDDIIADILKKSKLSQLGSMPICMKQIELMWKIIATQWKYSGKLTKKDKIIQTALLLGRSNFVDLKKQNAVTAYLFEHSNGVFCKLKDSGDFVSKNQGEGQQIY